MSFRGCLSGGGDIFSKSVEKQGGANRTFATGGRCHGWQLEPCPCGLEPLLTFRQKIPTGRPYIEEGHSKSVMSEFVSLTLNLLPVLDSQSRFHESLNNGWGLLGLDLSSGCPWVATKKGCSVSSHISTIRPSGDRPDRRRPCSVRTAR